ncbi:MAG: protein-L-isoaspartate(D-aspartate) O-methyltransferase [Candidatus Eisenbacteria bacterium]|nr:protein-L-isoaspartate(D-aspartate) O-methyltransferase [Candidatus Eisenbacteria bacterium]
MRPYRGAEEYRTARERMVRTEAIEKGIRDPRVLRALLEVPRHLFAEEALASRAYGAHALPIGRGQTLSQPYMVARMTEALELRGGEKVLEVGTGSGYQAAVLARAGCRVFSVERIPELAQRARKILDAIGAANVVVRIGDGSEGWPEFAPFDRILLTAGGRAIPTSLKDQLGEGGIVVAPVGERRQELLRVRKERGGERVETLGPCRFVPLVTGEGRRRKTDRAEPAGETDSPRRPQDLPAPRGAADFRARKKGKLGGFHPPTNPL